MEYLIKVEDGTTIASFKFEGDRDRCIDTLRDFYSDCAFDAVDDVEILTDSSEKTEGDKNDE